MSDALLEGLVIRDEKTQNGVVHSFVYCCKKI